MPFFILAKMRNFVFSKLMQITAKITQFRENDKFVHASHASGFSIFLHKFSRKQLFPFFKKPQGIVNICLFSRYFFAIFVCTLFSINFRGENANNGLFNDVFAKIENAKRLGSTQGTPGLS
jgi:hypothetical protein